LAKTANPLTALDTDTQRHYILTRRNINLSEWMCGMCVPKIQEPKIPISFRNGG